jgi:integrase
MTDSGRYVFPSSSVTRKYLAVEALDRAYARTLGLSGKHSPHGWRAAFRTNALEQGGFSRDATEPALDPIHDTDVVRAYDRGERLEERIRMARWWDEQLTASPKHSGVIPMRRKKK